LDDAGLDEGAHNQALTARRGRDPQLELLRNGRAVTLVDWGREILEGVRTIADLIDRGGKGREYSQAVDVQVALLSDAEATPSARLLQELRLAGGGFFEFAMQAARGHKEYFQALASLNAERLRHFESEARHSHRRQKEIEESDSLSFEQYLANYFAVIR
jgi:glutamate--cysteine ligase